MKKVYEGKSDGLFRKFVLIPDNGDGFISFESICYNDLKWLVGKRVRITIEEVEE